MICWCLKEQERCLDCMEKERQKSRISTLKVQEMLLDSLMKKPHEQMSYKEMKVVTNLMDKIDKAPGSFNSILLGKKKKLTYEHTAKSKTKTKKPVNAKKILADKAIKQFSEKLKVPEYLVTLYLSELNLAPSRNPAEQRLLELGKMYGLVK